jgi:hypothetical protein
MELSSIAELCEPSPEGQKQLIAQLHSRGLQALVKSSNGTTALHRLCENKQLTSDVLQVALQNDIISDAMVTLKRGEDDWTPLELLCGNSGLDCRWLRVMNDGSESSSAGWLTKRFKITLPAGPHQIYGRDTFLHHLCKNKNITYETLKYANLSANEWSTRATGRDKIRENDPFTTPLRNLCNNAIWKDLHKMLLLVPPQAWKSPAAYQSHLVNADRDHRRILHVGGIGSTRTRVRLLFECAAEQGSDLKKFLSWHKSTVLHQLCKNPCGVIALSRLGERINALEELEKKELDELKTFRKSIEYMWALPNEAKFSPFHIMCANSKVDKWALKMAQWLARLEEYVEENYSNECTPLHVLFANTDALGADLLRKVGKQIRHPKKASDAQFKLLDRTVRLDSLGTGMWTTATPISIDGISRPSTDRWDIIKQSVKNHKAISHEGVTPLDILCASCEHKAMDPVVLEPRERYLLFEVAMNAFPQLAWKMRTMPNQNTPSILREVLEREYERDQRSIDWLMGPLLWESPMEYERTGAGQVKTRLGETAKTPDDMMENPLSCAIAIQAVLMVEELVEQLLHREMSRNVRNLLRDLNSLCEIGLGNLAFRLLDEGGLYQIPMPHFKYIPALLDGEEGSATVGSMERQRWLTYREAGREEDPEHSKIQIGDFVSVKIDPRVSSAWTRRVARVEDFPPEFIAPFTVLEPEPEVEEEGKKEPQCKWLDGTEMLSESGKPYKIAQLRIVQGPDEAWRELGSRCGVTWHEDPDPDKRHWHHKTGTQEQSGRKLVNPAILAIDGAGLPCHDGLLHVLIHQAHNNRIETKVFGTDAVKLLVQHKWDEYGSTIIMWNIVVHFLFLVIPWTVITLQVAHRSASQDGPFLDESASQDGPILDAEYSMGTPWLFQGLSDGFASLAICLCAAAGFMHKFESRFRCFCCQHRQYQSQTDSRCCLMIVRMTIQVALMSISALLLTPDAGCPVSTDYSVQVLTSDASGFLVCTSNRLLKWDTDCTSSDCDQVWIDRLLGGVMAVMLTTISRNLMNEWDGFRSHFNAEARRRQTKPKLVSSMPTPPPITNSRVSSNQQTSVCCGISRHHVHGMVYQQLGSNEPQSELQSEFAKSEPRQRASCNTDACMRCCPLCSMCTAKALRRAITAHFDVWHVVDVLSLSLCFLTAYRLLHHWHRGTTSQIAAITTTLLWLRMIHYLSAFHKTAPFVRT